MKNIIKDLIFIGIFIMLLNLCTNIFVKKGNGYGSDVFSFYDLEKNSLDIIYFGSSHSYASFSPYIIEEETGLKGYNFATQQQPIYLTYYYMVEALKTQKPKYIVLEERGFSLNSNYLSEGVVRDAIDKMNPSINKIKAINTNVEKFEDRVSYYFNIIKYHSRYNELTLGEIKNGILKKGINNKGYIALPGKFDKTIDNTEILKTKEKEKISDKNLEYLEKIIKLTNENNINLIVIKSPCELTEKEQLNYNWLEEYLDNLAIVNHNYNYDFDKFNFVPSDFYDSGHLSGSGSEKFSKEFSNFLKENVL